MIKSTTSKYNTAIEELKFRNDEFSKSLETTRGYNNYFEDTNFGIEEYANER